MMELSKFLAFVDNFDNIYIKVDGEECALALRLFMREYLNWGFYKVYCIIADNSELIIKVMNK